ncbi:MAG: hypothetical protein GC164_04400 [Phycisphaera sp.]|nr:hypothetical protein [Phycisphaera sp.]
MDATPFQPIDIHSHLLYGIDDGCGDIHESIECVTRLKSLGYVGTVCTPHIWPELYPLNTIEHVRGWTAQLQKELSDAGIDYKVWPGGEVRLHAKLIDQCKAMGVPTLADSRCVLVDVWFDKWPKWVLPIFEFLLKENYQPILAHPERMNIPKELPKRMEDLTKMGVLLQGNFRSFTGEEGYHADRYVRQFMDEGRYSFLALDMHRPETLDARLDGIQLMAAAYGDGRFKELACDAPRKWVFAD